MKLLATVLLITALGVPLRAYALFEQCIDLFPEQRVPTTAQTGRDLCFDDFAIYYSPSDKKPIYTLERLNGAKLEGARPRRTNQFYEEARLPFEERALLADYRGSGFDRGHNVPAGDMVTERGMSQSFSLANIMPQARENNQGIWAKRVEEPTRAYAKRTAGDIYVFTGSTGQLGSIGKSKITVPAHLYKLVYDPSKKLAWAYWVENRDQAQMSPPISYAALKQKTGIDFHLPIQSRDVPPQTPTAMGSQPAAMVGGWYPIFFDQYSANKISALNSSIAAGKVASIDIQYDRNLELAQNIADEIKASTAGVVKLLQSSPPDSGNAVYERNRVVLIVRSK